MCCNLLLASTALHVLYSTRWVVLTINLSFVNAIESIYFNLTPWGFGDPFLEFPDRFNCQSQSIRDIAEEIIMFAGTDTILSPFCSAEIKGNVCVWYSTWSMRKHNPVYLFIRYHTDVLNSSFYVTPLCKIYAFAFNITWTCLTLLSVFTTRTAIITFFLSTYDKFKCFI